MSQPAAEQTPAALRSLASSLAPQLVEVCGGRLRDVVWFRTDWQRGGAATATATIADDQDRPVPVVIKLPVVQRELIWTTRLQNGNGDGEGVVPRLLASGQSLGGYDLAWIIVEKLQHGPLGTRWHDDHVPRLADAAARFYAAAHAFPIDRPARHETWEEMIEDGLKTLKDNRVADLQRWTNVLKVLRARLKDLAGEWEARATTGWIHGDLHPANAMSRQAIDAGPVTLIDLAEVRPGHWIEDAVYLERLLWSIPERLRLHKPVKAIAQARRALGLDNDADYPRLAMIRRALLAGTAPRFIRSEGSPAFLAACLERLEQALAEVK